MNQIHKLHQMFKKYIDLNKLIVDEQAMAVVPAKRNDNIPVNDLDIEEDYIFFCFTKFTKSLLSIQHLVNLHLYEDALILTRSNYECLIHAKSVIKYGGMIDHLVEYKLGLRGEKRYKFAVNKKGWRVKNKIIDKGTLEEYEYIEQVRSIAKKAMETDTYDHIYSYLCEMTHCNFITSGYYRDGIIYSYELISEKALYNVLLWNVYFNLKFYNTLIEAEILEIEDLEELVQGVLITDPIKVCEIFEFEQKRIIKLFEEQPLDSEKESIEEYLEILNKLKSNLS